MRYIIDRFEGSFAVCEQENGKFITIPRFHLPKEVKEGDTIVLKDGNYTIDINDTNSRSERINKKFNSLFIDE